MTHPTIQSMNIYKDAKQLEDCKRYSKCEESPALSNYTRLITMLGVFLSSYVPILTFMNSQY